MGNYYPEDKEKIKSYEILKSKYEGLEKEEEQLEAEISELKAKRFAVLTEKDFFSLHSGDGLKEITEQLDSDIKELEKEIDLKEESLNSISIKIDIYNNGLKQRIESKLEK